MIATLVEAVEPCGPGRDSQISGTGRRPSLAPNVVVLVTGRSVMARSTRRDFLKTRLQPLRRFSGDKWLDVAMIRMNNKGVKMDSMDTRNTDKLGDVKEVVERVKQVHSQGIGVISMKLAGEGRFTQREERQAALKFAMNVAGVDAVTIGYKNTSEIDEAIGNMNLAFA
jgi:hypothetical protein